MKEITISPVTRIEGYAAKIFPNDQGEVDWLTSRSSKPRV